ncbi:DUF6766 family protein [Streptomyces sp. WAC05374]|uniref:DUF6766 family protein n=1 Tax=Streptomyces sp. WAC05374 TaxID=2487420 RepID=UPI0037DCC938
MRRSRALQQGGTGAVGRAGLQFFLYVFATVWLPQRGSPESKELDKAGTESDEEQMTGVRAGRESPRWAAATDWRGAVYSRSLGGAEAAPTPQVLADR